MLNKNICLSIKCKLNLVGAYPYAFYIETISKLICTKNPTINIWAKLSTTFLVMVYALRTNNFLIHNDKPMESESFLT